MDKKINKLVHDILEDRSEYTMRLIRAVLEDPTIDQDEAIRQLQQIMSDRKRDALKPLPLM